jgi:hypothetical protein
MLKQRQQEGHRSTGNALSRARLLVLTGQVRYCITLEMIECGRQYQIHGGLGGQCIGSFAWLEKMLETVCSSGNPLQGLDNIRKSRAFASLAQLVEALS